MTFLGSKRLGNAFWNYLTYGTGSLDLDSSRYRKWARVFYVWRWLKSSFVLLLLLAVGLWIFVAGLVTVTRSLFG